MNDALTPAELWVRLGSPRRAVAVVAHPDDESFGLGAVLSALVDAGTSVAVLCLTHGEASTLGAAPDLAARRDGELRAAAAELGVDDVALFDYADGHLSDVDHDTLATLVASHVGEADLLVTFEPGGVTGHPDHRTASAVARSVAAHRGLPVLEWGVGPEVAAALRAELGAPFVALEEESGAAIIEVEVDRHRQLAAIACHRSQATDNPVLVLRLARQGPVERVRWRIAPVAPLAQEWTYRFLGAALAHHDDDGVAGQLVRELPPAGPVPPPEPTTAEVRAWARATGLDVAGRGRLHPDVWTAYRNARARW